jgi:dihydrofolate reductase
LNIVPALPDRTEEKEMGDLVVTEFVSMDGVMQAPGGEDFKYEGWSFDYARGDDGDEFKTQEIYDSEAQLLGRVTYDSFANAWPKYEEEGGEIKEFAKYFNEMKHYVVSSTLKDPEWTNTTVLDGDVAEQVSKVRDDVDGDVVVHGSAQLVQGLLEHGLVDELRLMVFPVVLGAGKRLFGETSDKRPLKLTDSKTVGDGVTIQVYEAAAA